MLIPARRFVAIVPVVAAFLLAVPQSVDAAPEPAVQVSAIASEQARATVAIGAGEGARAARIIARSGLAVRPDLLGQIIYEAGVLAVKADLGDEFSQAVATAFVDGGVTFRTANQAFAHGVMLVLAGAVGDEQLLAEIGPGGTAVLRTELAYFGLRLPALSFL